MPHKEGIRHGPEQKKKIVYLVHIYFSKTKAAMPEILFYIAIMKIINSAHCISFSKLILSDYSF